MKRSKRINIEAMRKAPVLRPSVLAVSVALVLSGCSSQEPATVYQSVEQCTAENPGHEMDCELAYEKALAEAERTGPRYRTRSDCESEFSANQCIQSSSGGWFMPAMAGFLIGRSFYSQPGYVPTPIYTSSSYRSRVAGGWYGADGTYYGSSSNRHTRVSPDTFKPKPAVTRTMSRGGFGSKAAAKSSWSSSRSSSSRSGSRGWGG